MRNLSSDKTIQQPLFFAHPILKIHHEKLKFMVITNIRLFNISFHPLNFLQLDKDHKLKRQIICMQASHVLNIIIFVEASSDIPFSMLFQNQLLNVSLIEVSEHENLFEIRSGLKFFDFFQLDLFH